MVKSYNGKIATLSNVPGWRRGDVSPSEAPSDGELDLLARLPGVERDRPDIDGVIEDLRVEPDLELTAWIGTTAPSWLAEEPWAGEVRWIRLPVPGIGTPWHLWHELAGINRMLGEDALAD